MLELHFCRDCEHQYEADEWERQEGDPPAEECPECKSHNTTTDPDLFPEHCSATYHKENPR